MFTRLWRLTKRIILFLLVAHLVYVVALRWLPPPITLTQIASLAEGNGLSKKWVDAAHISAAAKLAVIASEDQIFPDHNGFDWKSIRKAMEYNRRKPGRVRGASTISQQTAKNVFLWQDRSWLRKGLETYFTFLIEKIWGKQRILEVYMNVAETGKGIFGVEKAAEKFFGKRAANLSAQEAALIAAALPNPKKYLIKPPGEYMRARAAKIVQQMNFLRPDRDVQKITDPQ